MPASPLVNSPPATACLAGSSHHLPLHLHLNRQGEKRQIRRTQVENTVLKNYMLCALLPPDWRGETAFLVRDGRLEPK